MPARITAIRRYRSSARKCIDQASGQAGDMTTELATVLDQIAAEIRR